MTIVRCPNCQIERDVPGARLPKGRLRLNCRNCSKPFEFDNTGASPSAPPAAPAPPAPPERQPSSVDAAVDDGLDLSSGLQREMFDLSQVPAPPPPPPVVDRRHDEPLELDLSRSPSPPAPRSEARGEDAPGAALPLAFQPERLVLDDSGVPTRGQRVLRVNLKPEPFGYDSLPINVLAYPVALGLAALALARPELVPWLGWFRTFFHELGHVLVAWFGGRAATPFALSAGLGYSSIAAHKSPLVVVGLFLLLALTGFQAIRGRSRLLLAVTLLLFLAQIGLTLIAAPRRWEELCLLGGPAGELALATLLASLFYHRSPVRPVWGLLRFLVLPFALYGAAAASWTWLQVALGQREVPWGATGAGESAGDLMRLHQQFGWTPGELTAVYFGLAGACAAVVAAHYVLFIGRALARREAVLLVR